MTAAPTPPKPPPTIAIERRRGAPLLLDTEASQPVVAEGLVAFAHGLLEAALGGAADEVVALLGMAGDAVEEGAEQLRLVQALRVERLVDEHLHHHQLVDRQAGDPL